MRKNYERPKMEIALMGGEDIIQTSGGLTDGGEEGTVEGGGSATGGGVILGIKNIPTGIKIPGKFM